MQFILFQAINRVHPRTYGEFLSFETNGPDPCFANAGTMNVGISGVSWMNTGNNGAGPSPTADRVHKIEQITIY